MFEFLARLFRRKPSTPPQAPVDPERASALASLAGTLDQAAQTRVAELSATPTQTLPPQPASEPPPPIASLTPTVKRPQPTAAPETPSIPQVPVSETVAQAITELAPVPPPVTPSLAAEEAAARKKSNRVYHGEEHWGATTAQRDAQTDAVKLQRFGLPVFETESDIADWLGIPLPRLRWYTHDNPADSNWHYVRFTIPKRSGGQRVILAPKRDLKQLQRKVLAGLVAHVPVAVPVHGFVAKRSIVTNAQEHVGKKVVLKLDLKDFFPSVTYPRVRGLFVAFGYSYPVASALALLCTEYEREPFERDGKHYFVSVGPRHLVQGAPTSPALANLVAWKLDQRLRGLSAKRGFVYTRYADDLTFSGDDPEAVNALRLVAQRIIRDEHFTPNVAKTRIASQAARQIVTGLVVNEKVATPRQTRRTLRAIIHNAEKTGLATQNRDNRRDFGAYLKGMIAFVNASSAYHAAKLREGLLRINR